MNWRLLLQLAAALSLTFASILALAAVRADAPEIEVREPFSRASIGGTATGVVYLTLSNHGPEPDRLIAASTPVAGRADLHAHRHDGDVVTMRRLPSVALAPGETIMFEPGGLHIMLIGLTSPLREGDRFDLTLHFEMAGPVTVEVPVNSLAAGAAH